MPIKFHGVRRGFVNICHGNDIQVTTFGTWFQYYAKTCIQPRTIVHSRTPGNRSVLQLTVGREQAQCHKLRRRERRPRRSVGCDAQASCPQRVPYCRLRRSERRGRRSLREMIRVTGKKRLNLTELERLYWKSVSIYAILIVCHLQVAQKKLQLPFAGSGLRINL